jgi:hypothetical protein
MYVCMYVCMYGCMYVWMDVGTVILSHGASGLCVTPDGDNVQVDCKALNHRVQEVSVVDGLWYGSLGFERAVQCFGVCPGWWLHRRQQ